MKHPIVLVLIVGLMASVTMAQPGHAASSPPQDQPPGAVIGIVPQEIADSSPVASAVVSAPHEIFKAGTDIDVRMVLQNRSDHSIGFNEKWRRGFFFADVRDTNGELPRETEWGCIRHFFSPCHTVSSGRGIYRYPLDPWETWETVLHLSKEYELTAGKYTVAGYLCGMKEGPECFKTNAITIAVE